MTEKFKDKQLRMQRDDLNYLINLFRNALSKPFEESSEIDKVELVKLSDLMCLLSSSDSNCDYDKELINKELISLLIGKNYYKLLSCFENIKSILSSLKFYSTLDNSLDFYFDYNLAR